MPATSFIKKANLAVYEFLNFDSRQDFLDANRGLIAPLEAKVIKDDSGEVAWDIEQLSYLNDTVPETVNPSLWKSLYAKSYNCLFRIIKK